MTAMRYMPQVLAASRKAAGESAARTPPERFNPMAGPGPLVAIYSWAAAPAANTATSATAGANVRKLERMSSAKRRSDEVADMGRFSWLVAVGNRENRNATSMTAMVISPLPAVKCLPRPGVQDVPAGLVPAERGIGH